jgi:hypothetical protein
MHPDLSFAFALADLADSITVERFQADEAFDENLTKAEASRRIDELQARTGRGQP